MTVIVNIGSNLGQKRLNLSKAMQRINRRFGDFEISHVVESKPSGFDSTHDFLNLCMMFQTEEDPLAVLHALQEIEREISPEPHRNPDGTYRDRVVDIDIVAIDDRVIDNTELQVPHPRLAERRFFLEPLAEIAPGWRHPITGLDAMQMLSNLPAESDQQPPQ